MQSSVFRQGEPTTGTFDQAPHIDIGIYYDGTAAIVPLLAAGLLQFPGAIATTGSDGFPLAHYAFPIENILPGGKGVALRCCMAPTKQRLRFDYTGTTQDNVLLELRPVSTPGAPKLYDQEFPLVVVYEEDRVETPCQKLTELARLFNTYYSDLGVASVVVENSKYVLDIEVLVAGDMFHVQKWENLSEARVVVPGVPPRLLPAHIPSLFGVVAPAGNCLKSAELHITQIREENSSGTMTSNLGQYTQNLGLTQRGVTIAFANNTNGNAAYDALVAILAAQTRLYASGANPTCTDAALYPYSIERTDAGDAAALATLKSDYSAIGVWTVGRSGGKTLYTITTGSSVTPTGPNGNTDTIRVGSAMAPGDALPTIPC